VALGLVGLEVGGAARGGMPLVGLGSSVVSLKRLQDFIGGSVAVALVELRGGGRGLAGRFVLGEDLVGVAKGSFAFAAKQFGGQVEGVPGAILAIGFELLSLDGLR
jgi:hypothetical protein